MNERAWYRQWVPDEPYGDAIIFAHWRPWGFRDDCEDKPFTEPYMLPDGTYPESFQSTGLRDSTRTKEFPEGREIFDADIMGDGVGPNAIVFQDTSGEWKLGEPSCSYSLERELKYDKNLTVIGNTTKNPDMMEVEK